MTRTLQDQAAGIAEIARRHGAEWTARTYPSGVLVQVRLSGATAFIDLIDRAVPQYVLAWHSRSGRLSKSFAQWVAPHGYRATTRCFSFQGLQSVLDCSLKRLAAGSAFEPDHRSLINVNA